MTLERRTCHGDREEAEAGAAGGEADPGAGGGAAVRVAADHLKLGK